MAAAKEEIELQGVRLTSPDKVLYPEQGVTKRELAEYYLAVAGVMLPHVARRPITLVRCPTGRARKCFYQRHAGSGMPAELKQIPIEGFEEPYLYLEDVRGLVALVQMGVLEIHPWNSHVDQPHKPDQVIFDLDPGEGLAFPDVVAAAHELRARLAGLGLRSVPKTTGGKGLHLVVPIERRYEWRDVKSFAKAVGDLMAKDAPDRFLTKQSIAERRGRIYIDYLRNDPTSTAVAPYSTRSREGAPVSVPLTWDEVVPDLDPRAFTVRTVPARVAGLTADPWADIAGLKQRLPKLT
ncbi:non-homologous end-joining DNA ligase [Enterovirga aerilata]|uniref:DNA polymerase domain-containing protein n=1 Tax=Enterovirga aerilata TaxID=2730920 RepID=A0A849I6W6_9HYPH|nr:non-homologous end-joining DNA ligase [Enterovirga sp. DB1703]NNM73031.1 DNA polymerase domain-containing protein [Enterovirga sp. DB1703]